MERQESSECEIMGNEVEGRWVRREEETVDGDKAFMVGFCPFVCQKYLLVFL